MRWARLTLGAALVACAGAGVAHGAAPIWHAPVPIAPQGAHPGPPGAALASRGEALAAWPATVGRRVRLEVRERHGLRAPWSPPEVLSALGPGRPFPPPVVALNARGDAVVLWGPEDGWVRSAVRRGRTGSWRRMPVAPPAPNAAPGAAAVPQVAIAPDGGAVAIWATVAAGAWVVRGARLPRGAAAWEETPPPPLDPDRLAPPGEAPRLALGARGDAVVLWGVPAPRPAGSPLPANALRAARRTGVGGWGPAITLADAARSADAAIAANGRAAAVWTDATAGLLSPLRLALGEPGAPGFAAPETLSQAAPLTRVAVNPRGDVLVAWTGLWTDLVAHAAIRAPDGVWSPALDVRGRYPVSFLVALDEAGTGHVGAFSEEPDSQAHEWPFSIVAGRASGWGPPRLVAAGDSAASLATAPDGTALVLARGSDGTGIFAAGYDGAPDVRVAARARGRWDAGRRIVRWTVRVRNAGRIGAQGVRVRLRAGERGRLLSSRPPAEIGTGRRPLWRLGRLAPGSGRTIRAVVRPRERSARANLQVEVFAGGMPPAWSPWSVATPSR